MLLTELYHASRGRLMMWGSLLLLVNLGTVVLAIVLQSHRALSRCSAALVEIESTSYRKVRSIHHGFYAACPAPLFGISSQPN